jgi:phosphoribosylformylglycinamidine synthase
MGTGYGFTISTDDTIRKDAFLFGEAQGRIVVTIDPALKGIFEAEMTHVPHTLLGNVHAEPELLVDDLGWGFLSEWQEAYDTALEKMLVS